MADSSYAFAADMILLAHAMFVAFVVVSLPLILIGKARHWRWVRNSWFRYTHLLSLAIVILQSWLGVVCPLTRWEMLLRHKAGHAVYGEGFIAHWLGNLLYFSAPPWVFATLYTAFGVLVATTWYWVRPGR